MAKKKKAEELLKTINEIEDQATPPADMQNAGQPKVEVRDADKDGNRFLPGQEREFIVIEELREAIKNHKLVLTPAFQSAQKALSVSKELIEVELMRKYKDQLPFDEDRQVYTYDDGEVHYEIKETLEVSFSVVQ